MDDRIEIGFAMLVNLRRHSACRGEVLRADRRSQRTARHVDHHHGDGLFGVPLAAINGTRVLGIGAGRPPGRMQKAVSSALETPLSSG